MTGDPTDTHAAQVTRIRAALQPLTGDPDLYWPTLVALFCQDLGVLDDVHRTDCQRPAGCRTCAELRNAWVVLDAHDALQTSGCACANHITYPRRAPAEA